MTRRGWWLTYAGACALAGAIAVGALAQDRWYAVDGDTLRNLRTGERLRLIGIDAPELHPARCERERSLGLAARAFLQHRIEIAREVRVERRDRYPDGRRDRYGRTPAVVLVDGVDVAHELVKDGFARPYAGGERQGWCP